MSILGKRADALEIAYAIIESEETVVTVEQVVDYDDEELYTWLEAWGYAHDGKDWYLAEAVR